MHLYSVELFAHRKSEISETKIFILIIQSLEAPRSESSSIILVLRVLNAETVISRLAGFGK
jgi:hypothetical protein